LCFCGRRMKGTYTIIVNCNAKAYCRFGRLGTVRLRRGLYVYTGSARGYGSTSLERRIERHKKLVKRRRWHIDYLISMPDCRVSGVTYLVSERRLECKISQAIAENLNLAPPLRKVGASDCDCQGHLVGPESHFDEAELLKRLLAIYRRVGGMGSSIVSHRLN
jgi:Uri superfamily endonuclease